MNQPALFAYISASICALSFVAYLISILARKRHSVARWSFAGCIGILGFESFATGMSLSATSAEIFLYWQQMRLITLSLIPGSWILFSLTYARGTTKDFLKRWRYTLIVAFALPAILAIFYHDSYILFRQIKADGSISIRLGWPGQIAHFSMILGSILAMTNLERTYRSAVGTLRWRVKFMILGLGTLFLVRFYTSSQAILFAHVHSGMDSLNSIGLIVSSVFILWALKRKGNFDIELYPSHAILSNSITILLAGIYLLAVGLLAKLVTLIGGDIAFSLKALGVLVAIVLFATLLQSSRFRLHIKQFVSRHFSRPMHDYRTVWRRFTEETSSHVRQTDLCKSIVQLISEIFDALMVNVWIFSDDQTKLRLVASTSLVVSKGVLLELPSEGIEKFRTTFLKSLRPVDLDKSKEKWADALKEVNPKKFLEGGNRVCIPMRAGDSLLGVIVIGDRVNGALFSEQEFDILSSVGTHAASSLLTLQLSSKLLETRELEAFQTMATFFVHDLKNAASTLNIMVKNLPIHWDNPDFREDALRGISKTGDRINQLIGRLSSVRTELEVEAKAVEIDLFASSVAESWHAPDGIEFTTDFNSNASAKVDSDQLGKVLLNLIINAAESMQNGGLIEARTQLVKNHVVLSVRDDGCGMSEEFIAKSLFRPFKTTKKSGLGIGMFQSKMIVEAHGGRFEVTSEEGKGSTFRVLLPVDKKT